MELFIASRDDMSAYDQYVTMPSMDEDGGFVKDSNMKEKFKVNMFKSSKTIWVDLEPGFYTIQILSFR